jgi:hypothetical protein
MGIFLSLGSDAWSDSSTRVRARAATGSLYLALPRQESTLQPKRAFIGFGLDSLTPGTIATALLPNPNEAAITLMITADGMSMFTSSQKLRWSRGS